MYNRYVPQPDGSFRRNRVLEPHNHQPQPPQPQKRPPELPAPPPPPPCPIPEHSELPRKCAVRKEPPCKQENSISSFFRNILPRDLDTGDLLVIILLLLMAGDCAEDQNTAMLTLALYLFM